MNPTLQKLFDEHNYEMLGRAIADLEDDKEFLETIESIPVEALHSIAGVDPTLALRMERVLSVIVKDKEEGMSPDVNKYERIYDPD